MGKEGKRRGRPLLGDRPLTRAEHEAKRRARIAVRLDETRVELTNTFAELRKLLSHITLSPTAGKQEAVQAEDLVSSLQAKVELLLADIGRLNGSRPSGIIFCPGQVIRLPHYRFAIWHVSETHVWTVPIKGKNGTPRHRSEIPIDDPLKYGISIRYPVVQCDLPAAISILRLSKAVLSGSLPGPLLQKIIDGIRVEAQKNPSRSLPTGSLVAPF